MPDDQREQPELPLWLEDQLGALVRDTATAVHAAWQRIGEHVPAEVLEGLPDRVLLGTGPNAGAFRFLDDADEVEVEVRDRGDGATVVTRAEVLAYAHGVVIGRMSLPRQGPPADPSTN